MFEKMIPLQYLVDAPDIMNGSLDSFVPLCAGQMRKSNTYRPYMILHVKISFPQTNICERIQL
jgi:hypothetical protein